MEHKIIRSISQVPKIRLDPESLHSLTHSFVFQKQRKKIRKKYTNKVKQTVKQLYSGGNIHRSLPNSLSPFCSALLTDFLKIFLIYILEREEGIWRERETLT